MSLPSPDAKAVVRAAEALTTQVKRIADALTTPVVRYEVATDDDATTPATTCSARWVKANEPMRWCIRPAHHAGQDHVDELGYHWSDTVAVYPLADGMVKHWTPDRMTPDFTSPLTGIEVRVPCPDCRPPAMIPRALIADHIAREHMTEAPATDEAPPLAACRRMETRTCPPSYNGPCGDRPCARFESDDPTPWLDTSTEEQTLRWARRESLLVLLTRLQRGRTLTEDEARTLREHVEHEMREAEQLRAGRETWKRKAEEMERDRDRAAEARDEEERLRLALADERNRWKERAEEERGMRQQLGRDIEGWIRLAEHHQAWGLRRWNAWKSARARAQESQAAIERVRAVPGYVESVLAQSGPGVSRQAVQRIADRLRAALDGTEQPAEIQPEPSASNFAAYQAAIVRVALVLREAQRHREQTDPSERQDCVICGADHFAEIRAAIKDTQPANKFPHLGTTKE
jgi:hypothetical protein